MVHPAKVVGIPTIVLGLGAGAAALGLTLTGRIGKLATALIGGGAAAGTLLGTTLTLAGRHQERKAGQATYISLADPSDNGPDSYSESLWVAT